MNKLDVYSDMTVPFDVAVLCRGHKFSPVVVNLARALKRKEEAERAQQEAEAAIEKAQHEINTLAEAVREKFGG